MDVISKSTSPLLYQHVASLEYQDEEQGMPSPFTKWHTANEACMNTKPREPVSYVKVRIERFYRLLEQKWAIY